MAGSPAQAAELRSQGSLAHKLHVGQSAGKISITRVWSQDFPVSLCRKSGAGINRPSSEREGEKEGRRGSRDGKGRKRRGKREERKMEREGGGRKAKRRERQRHSNQGDEDRKSWRRTRETEKGTEGWLGHLYRQVRGHSSSCLSNLCSRP